MTSINLPPNVTLQPAPYGTVRRYIGLDSHGKRWQITKHGRNWIAIPMPGNPAFGIGTEIEGTSLTVVAQLLLARKAPRALTPF